MASALNDIRQRFGSCMVHIWRLLNLYNLSLRFNGHFPGEPELADVYCSKG